MFPRQQDGVVDTVKGLSNAERGDVYRAATGVTTPKNGVEKHSIIPMQPLIPPRNAR